MHMTFCPCGSGRIYADCCQPLHAGSAAGSAEALMRSRYSAYVLGLRDYLLQSWHPDTRPSALELEAVNWLGLKILEHEQQDDAHATVTFVARYKVNGRAFRLEESSRFTRVNGRWVYRDAIDSQENF